GAEQEAWLSLLEREQENVRAALAWSLDAREPLAGQAPDMQSQPRREPVEIGMLLAGAIWRYWHVRGQVTEGRAWLSRLLARSLAGDTAGDAAGQRAK